MQGIVLNYLNRLTLPNVKEHWLITIMKELNNDRAQKSEPPPAEPATYRHKTVGCSCCQWKGKVADAEKNYVFLEVIAEIELFCPQCKTYIGFVTDRK